MNKQIHEIFIVEYVKKNYNWTIKQFLILNEVEIK